MKKWILILVCVLLTLTIKAQRREVYGFTTLEADSTFSVYKSEMDFISISPLASSTDSIMVSGIEEMTIGGATVSLDSIAIGASESVNIGRGHYLIGDTITFHNRDGAKSRFMFVKEQW